MRHRASVLSVGLAITALFLASAASAQPNEANVPGSAISKIPEAQPLMLKG